MSLLEGTIQSVSVKSLPLFFCVCLCTFLFIQVREYYNSPAKNLVYLQCQHVFINLLDISVVKVVQQSKLRKIT